MWVDEVFERESVQVGNCEKRHLETDERVRQTHRDAFTVRVGTEMPNRSCRDEDRDPDGLPEREKQDSLHTQEFWHGPINRLNISEAEQCNRGDTPKRLQVLADAHPEHGQAIQTETDTEVVHYADV